MNQSKYIEISYQGSILMDVSRGLHLVISI